ncbi:hypothetical protein DFH08DRAFT_773085 [Mycena albidolilacea]|uniref:Uncharacterized protein n=1 Tax=Mycena albidolilacea TaxID=1033008 RepID=A0AAD7EWI5_9AGAR|nr:hypothetical protein DFH08DRAFT_773085 [Mycena albidolilacea]
MPITEVVTLAVTAPYTHQSVPLRQLQTLASRQSAYSAYPVLFFADTNFPSRIYMLSGWHDVEASYVWLDSPDWVEMLALLEPFGAIQSRIFIGIDFDAIPRHGVLLLRRQTRVTRLRSSPASAFWQASGEELDAQTNGTYTIEIYSHDDLDHLPMDNSVSMRQLSLSRLG